MFSDNAMMSYLNNHCITIWFDYALEANSAEGGAKISSNFPMYFGASGLLLWYKFCHSMFN